MLFFSIVHNPYDEQVYLCVAMTKNVLLMQWYEPLDKFMKVKVIHVITVFYFRCVHVEDVLSCTLAIKEASVNIEHCLVECTL